MYPFCSLLQTVYQFVKNMFTPLVNMTKRMYRTAAIIMAGSAVVAVMTFSSAGFAGGGHNALTAYAETPDEEDSEAAEPEVENPEPAEAESSGETQHSAVKVQLSLTDPENLRSGQLLAGDTIARNIQEQDAVRQEQKTVIAENEEETRRVEEERRRKAEEEAARRAEEERRHAEAEAARASSVISFSDQDYEVLKQIVEAEAGGCDMEGRILVANVILNRVRDGEFPSTITDVVYQRSQFSPVSDGRLKSCSVSKKTVEAVNRALAGEDHSQGALFFMNRLRSRSSNVNWFDRNLTYLFQHEKHEFFR